MIGVLLIAVSSVQALQRAVGDCREGRFVEAWAAAQGAASPIERSCAETYVRYHAGDLEGALQAAETGLTLNPRDEYLNPTATELALTLRVVGSAARHLENWQRECPQTDEARCTRLRQELQGQREAESALLAAESRAKWGVLAGALLGVLGFFGLLGSHRSTSGRG